MVYRGVNGFVGVEDVAKLAVLFLKTPVNGQRFIVNSGGRAFKDLMYKIADCFGKNILLNNSSYACVRKMG